jgi:arginyl-tRNA synthetase
LYVWYKIPVGAGSLAKAPDLSPHIHNLPAMVGKPDFATDNAQFFHLRIDAPPLCG